MRFVAMGLLVISAACAGPGKREQESVRKAQELFKGQDEAMRHARIPDSHAKTKTSEERSKQ